MIILTLGFLSNGRINRIPPSISFFHRGVVGVGSVGARAPTDFLKVLIEIQVNTLEQ